MRPEDASACAEAIFMYKNPQHATVSKIKDLYEKYNVDLYLNLNFCFIRCIKPPRYIMPSKHKEGVLHLCGGTYTFENFPHSNYSKTNYSEIDTTTYHFVDDARPFYIKEGYVYDFLQPNNLSSFNGIIIGPEDDFLKKYGNRCSVVTMEIGGEKIQCGDTYILPDTSFIKACTVTEDQVIKND